MANTKFSQSGIALPMVLIFLVVMMLIGAVAIRNVTLDEKMAGNARNQQVAFQAAEQALRFCETGAQKNALPPKPAQSAKALSSMLTPTVNGANAWDTWPAAATTTVTLSAPGTNIPGPQCIIEDVSSTISLGPTQSKRNPLDKVYRVTAFGVGDPASKAKVLLQSYLSF
ncbi:pilus assembly PilX family protein [Collimonas pratensis]|uniref:PilX N-terminal family protein n=1 Tax=Collimonas pratensis TaxID=279113 RepID=A0ABM5ZBU0_9BURK|nr:PilX N-terminal domain-containing pilus assembly protein [Collimonas pratensis]AMP16573.1 pilX N-terminal family protein [Collimonas pratensis]